jgi:hypothetical protein
VLAEAGEEEAPERHLVPLQELEAADGDGVSDLTIDLVRKQHTDPALYHKDPNPATLAPRLLWLSTVLQSG